MLSGRYLFIPLLRTKVEVSDEKLVKQKLLEKITGVTKLIRTCFESS